MGTSFGDRCCEGKCNLTAEPAEMFYRGDVPAQEAGLEQTILHRTWWRFTVFTETDWRRRRREGAIRG